jgi:hypothetical protein
MLGIGPYGAGGPNGDVKLPDSEAPVAVTASLGIGNQGLSGTDTNAGGATHCNADWCSIWDKYAGQVPLYLQTVSASSPDGTGMTGSLVPLLPFAMSHHTQIFEVYLQDFQVAYDTTSPAYAQYGAAYQAAFQAAANVLGLAP